MVKKLSCVSHGSLKRFPHTFTKPIYSLFKSGLIVFSEILDLNSPNTRENFGKSQNA